MPSCRDLCRAIATDELREAGPWTRLRARLHLLLCRHCRRYAAQIAAFGREAGALSGQPADEEASLKRLRAAILDSSKPKSSE